MAETLSQPDPDSWKIFIATSIERSNKLTLIKVYVVFAKKNAPLPLLTGMQITVLFSQV